MAERLFVLFTREEGQALAMLAPRSPAERRLAVALVARIRAAVESPPSPDAVDPQVTHRAVH
jgi:hypothetical protein